MSERDSSTMPPGRQRYVPAVGPRLKRLLAIIFFLFAVITVNSVYLVSVTIAGVEFQNWFYLIMFLVHLGLGLALVLPVVAFGVLHIRNAWKRPNRRAVRAGLALFATSLVVLATGFVLLVRFDGQQPLARTIAYWLHVIGPLVAIWLFVLHRLAGTRIRWRVGLGWAGVAAVFAGVMVVVHRADPRAWNVAGPASGERYFFPSLARTSTGNFIPADVLERNDYCLECHETVHDQWAHSAHRFSSFNNPPYTFSVKETRRALVNRDGNVHGSRFCAGCHDPVPFFSGAFDDPKFDDPEYDLARDPMAQAGITCTVCHSIVHVNGVRGNADYTIDEPMHYPFAFSESPLLRWVNRQLVKAKPAFHKATFLKPLHRTTEFCGACHKVHLPVEFNGYKWLRGQNHFDSFWTSGVSGYGVASFYYPPKAQENCNGCHMPLAEVDAQRPNFAARVRDDSGQLKTVGHQFPSANTGIVHLLRDQMARPDEAIAAHAKFNEGVMRIDLFGLRQEGRIDGALIAPLRPEAPPLEPGASYLLETVIRTIKMGHAFTQGTADSNEVWLDLTMRAGDRVIGRSGEIDSEDGAVDPWSHFVNAFVIDRDGNRINRRNPQDIFIALYDHQIPPGAADVVHYTFKVPADAEGTIVIEAALRYRKFDTEYMRLVHDDPGYVNDLPIMTLAVDRIELPVASDDAAIVANAARDVPEWERWNDYGIGLLRRGRRGELRQAAEAFAAVERLGRPDGPVNLARVHLKEGGVQDLAQQALERAAAFDPPANEWTLLWLGAEVAAQNGEWERATGNLREIVRGGFAQAQGRGFDFSKDYRVRDALGAALYQTALGETGPTREETLRAAAAEYEAALAYEPEDLAAHWGLKQVYGALGDAAREEMHAQLHARYKPDDNARDRAVAAARIRYPAADRAAEEVVLYDLQRPGADESMYARSPR
jgi:hypothetical protein